MYSMSSYPVKKARISEPYPCPDCGVEKMSQVVETCRLEDGLVVKNLQHYKCRACGAQFFDDSAMHRIQSARANKVAHAT